MTPPPDYLKYTFSVYPLTWDPVTVVWLNWPYVPFSMGLSRFSVRNKAPEYKILFYGKFVRSKAAPALCSSNEWGSPKEWGERGLKIGIALETLMTLQVSMSDSNQDPSGDPAASLPPITLKKCSRFVKWREYTLRRAIERPCRRQMMNLPYNNMVCLGMARHMVPMLVIGILQDIQYFIHAQIDKISDISWYKRRRKIT